MMARVRATLETTRRSGVTWVPPEGDTEVNVAGMRRRAEIDMDFLSGSDRPFLGGAVRLGKRLVRRSLRWYLAPMMAQQSRFNHATLDAIEQLRLRVNQLGAELDQLRHPDPDGTSHERPPPDDVAGQ